MDDNDDNVINFQKICRLCLLEKRILYSIFEYSEDGELPIEKRIMACTNVVLNEGDGLPSKVCKKCLSFINISYEFRLQCEKADKTLHQLLSEVSQKNIKTEPEPQSKDEKAFNQDNDEELPVHEFVETTMKQTKEGQTKRAYVRRRPSNRKVHRCEPCGKTFSTWKVLARHEWTLHGTRLEKAKKAYSCTVCSELFSSSAKLNEHEKTLSHHGKEQCPLCHKSFSKYYMTEHLRHHTGEKPYLCNLCGCSFGQVSAFYKHKKQCSNAERKWKCAYCERSYHERYPLKEHERIHTNEKPFVCEACGKAFRRRGKMLLHQLLHTNEKPHTCTVCGRAFRQRSHLTEHTRVHSGVKPFICDVCGASFTQGHSLKSHKAKHV